MTGESLDIVQNQLEKLKQLFPEVVTEGKIDWEKLQASLGKENIEFSNERYVLNWAGKSDDFKVLQQPTTVTLKPAPDESVNFDTTQNVFIEGENLEVLKVLQKSYYGKVKCIIIDPPYNTGNDSFIYPDSFKEKKDDYLKRIGEKDEEGYLLKEGMFRRNSKDSGHYHSNWLSMMYPRLFLAKNLLRDDGVIFVHIDDNEVHNLRMIMNEIFGEENFIECITWNKRVPKNDKGIGSIHEYILIFVKDASIKHEFLMVKDGLVDIEELLNKLKKQKIPLLEAEKEIRKLFNKKGYDRGITLYNSLNSNYRLWGKINMSWPNANTFGPRYEVKHPKNGKSVKIPERGWRWKEDTFKEAAQIIEGNYKSIIELHDGTFLCGKIWFDKDEFTQPSSINFLDELDKLLLRSIISLKSDGGIEVENLFDGKSYFSYPKPTSLPRVFLKSIDLKDGDIILDFFSGSGTTAQAILELNKEYIENCKFILVQLPELCDENSEAYKAGYKTIADICKERVRRVIVNFEKEREFIEKESSALNLQIVVVDKEIAEIKSKLNPELFGAELTNPEIERLIKKRGIANEKLLKNSEIIEKIEACDKGFKVFKLSSSNFKIWRGNEITEENLVTQLDAFTDPVREGSEKENMLYELMLKAGYLLTDKLVLRQAQQTGEFYSIKDGELIVALERMSQPLVEEIIAAKPKKVITLDKLFAGNDQLKTNTVLQMRDGEIDFKTI